MTKTQITAAINEQIPTLTAIYERFGRNEWARLESFHGDNPGLRASNTYGMTETARTCRAFTGYESSMPNCRTWLDEERLIAWATKNAEALAAEYAAKVERKAEGMDVTSITRMDTMGRFDLKGTKVGLEVALTQSIVGKYSPKGNYFHQFPCLVYIAGRKSTEKALLAL